jgi:hypothetical protein
MMRRSAPGKDATGRFPLHRVVTIPAAAGFAASWKGLGICVVSLTQLGDLRFPAAIDALVVEE